MKGDHGAEGTYLFSRPIPERINLGNLPGVSVVVAENNADIAKSRNVESRIAEIIDSAWRELGELGLPGKDGTVLWCRGEPRKWRWADAETKDQLPIGQRLSWATSYIMNTFGYGERSYMLAQLIHFHKRSIDGGDISPWALFRLGEMIGRLKLFDFEGDISKQRAWKDKHHDSVERASDKKNAETKEKRRQIQEIAVQILTGGGTRPSTLTHLARMIEARKVIRARPDENGPIDYMKSDTIRRHLREIAKSGVFDSVAFLKAADK